MWVRTPTQNECPRSDWSIKKNSKDKFKVKLYLRPTLREGGRWTQISLYLIPLT
jgi:hypothetical protein